MSDRERPTIVEALVDAANAFEGLCDELKLFVGEERHRRNLEFKRLPRDRTSQP